MTGTSFTILPGQFCLNLISLRERRALTLLTPSPTLRACEGEPLGKLGIWPSPYKEGESKGEVCSKPFDHSINLESK